MKLVCSCSSKQTQGGWLMGLDFQAKTGVYMGATVRNIEQCSVSMIIT